MPIYKSKALTLTLCSLPYTFLYPTCRYFHGHILASIVSICPSTNPKPNAKNTLPWPLVWNPPGSTLNNGSTYQYLGGGDHFWMEDSIKSDVSFPWLIFHRPIQYLVSYRYDVAMVCVHYRFPRKIPQQMVRSVPIFCTEKEFVLSIYRLYPIIIIIIIIIITIIIIIIIIITITTSLSIFSLFFLLFLCRFRVLMLLLFVWWGCVSQDFLPDT